jgi:spore coat protein CotH
MPLYVYESPLPVYEIDLAAADWDEMTADPYTTRTAPATLTIGGGKPRQGTARLRGGSSRDLLKPSLQFRLDEPDEGEARVVVLRAEWVDKTMLRNHLSMELLRRSTWLPASATEFVHGRVNGRPKGLMLRTERLDDDFLEARGLDENAALYEADPPAGIKGGANLMPADPAVYETLYEKQVGPPGYDDLIALIDAAIPGGDVAAAVSVDDLVPLLAFWAVIQDADHVRKNYDLFRNPAFLSGRFVFIPWDLDLTWGHLWTEAEDVMDETIFVDLDPRTGSSAVTPGSRTA